MVNVIGVRFRHAGKVYYFAPGELEIRAGDHVIVETARGIEYGEVRQGSHEVEEDQVTQPLKEVIRLATEEDTEHEMDNREKEKEAFRVCKKRITEKDLDMKLIYCEYTFDNSKILFYFTADGRVDFRDLVKELASVFRTRIELRQVGVRDETKLLGGLGSCGRPLCCTTYLSDFAPVSIKMAKEQNLSLNPVKISGVCGRLMCCLGNEEEVYEELNRKLPGVGDLVDVADGSKGEVLSVGILKQLVKVVVELPGDEKEVREYPAEDVTVRIRRREKNRMREEKEFREREIRKEREKAAAADTDKYPETEEESFEKKETKDRRDRRDRRTRENGTVPETAGKREETAGPERENRSGRDKKEKREYPDNREKRDSAGNRENKDSREKHSRSEHKPAENSQNREKRDGGEKREKNGKRERRDGGSSENRAPQEKKDGEDRTEKHENRDRRHRERKKDGIKTEGQQVRKEAGLSQPSSEA